VNQGHKLVNQTKLKETEKYVNSVDCSSNIVYTELKLNCQYCHCWTWALWASLRCCFCLTLIIWCWLLLTQ